MATKTTNLKDLMAKDYNLSALIKHIAKGDVKGEELTMDVVEKLIHTSRYESLRLLHVLADAGWGQFLAGRRKFITRVRFTKNPLPAARELVGEEPKIEQPKKTTTMPNSQLISHAFRLRNDVQAEVWLPDNLTASEAKRLALYIQSLPLEG